MDRVTPTRRVRITKVSESRVSVYDDVAGEEPLEIRVDRAGTWESLLVTMRTPGDDFNLVAGWLHSEGIINDAHAILSMRYCTDLSIAESERFNIVLLRLRGRPAPERGRRSTFATAACGVCGTAALEDIRVTSTVNRVQDPISKSLLLDLPRRLSPRQSIFARTGGVHAAGLFDHDGMLLHFGEDIGRHNAVDKAIGSAVLNGDLERCSILLTSGRAGYEILQKAAVAGVGTVASVSAPSSLAIDVAHEAGITLLAFLRDRRFNIYTHPTQVDNE